MSINNNCDKERRKRCAERTKEDKSYVGPHKVDIKFDGLNAIVSWHQGGLVPNEYDHIKVKHNPFAFFGIRKPKLWTNL